MLLGYAVAEEYHSTDKTMRHFAAGLRLVTEVPLSIRMPDGTLLLNSVRLRHNRSMRKKFQRQHARLWPEGSMQQPDTR